MEPGAADPAAAARPLAFLARAAATWAASGCDGDGGSVRVGCGPWGSWGPVAGCRGVSEACGSVDVSTAAEEGAASVAEAPAAGVSVWPTTVASTLGATSRVGDVGSAAVSASPVAAFEASAREDGAAGISDAMHV